MSSNLVGNVRDSLISNIHMSLPLELIDEVVHHILDGAPPRSEDSHELGKNSKPDWSLIHSFTLTCRSFRQLGLALWFRRLFIVSEDDLKVVDAYFPLLKGQWCRHLHCVQPTSGKVFIWSLYGFKHVTSLRVDWLHKKAILQDISGEEVIPFIDVQCPISELDIRGVQYPSPMMIKALTNPFPNISRLKLDLVRVWCGLCHTVTFVRLPNSAPKSFLYKGGIGLPIHYARALLAHDSLEEVLLRLPDLGNGELCPGLSGECNDSLWVGECERCMSLMYEDEHFRKSWVARKQGIIENGVDERHVYKAPPCLQMVQWTFREFDRERELSDISDEEDDMETEDDEHLVDSSGDEESQQAEVSDDL